jgi:uncharacterized protein (DUF427 family)
MSLASSGGPLSRAPRGQGNYHLDAPEHRLYLEPVAKRLRAVVGGEVIADTSRGRLLHETGLMAVYYVPIDDVRQDLLTATEHTTHCPFKGDASYWTVTVGDDVRENAVWSYPEPLEGAPPFAGLVAFYDHAIDAWYEESERLPSHPRDPYHRVDVVPSDRHVTVEVDGIRIAESRRPTMLFETGLPARTYLPEEDVRMDLLTPSDTRTVCPYKGNADRYWSIPTDDGVLEDVVWAYDDPRPEANGIAGLLAFLDAKVEITWTVQRFATP